LARAEGYIDKQEKRGGFIKDLKLKKKREKGTFRTTG
jgi:hypothetical protein